MRSMTGCGRGCRRDGDWEVTVEIRSVNHRFLDLSCRLPRNLAFLEDVVRKRLAAGVKRGHLDAYITVNNLASGQREVFVDEQLAQLYASAAKVLQPYAGGKKKLSVSRLMALEGVVQVRECAMDEEQVSALCALAVADAVEQLVEMRQREGAALREDLLSHLDNAAVLREEILDRAPRVVEEYRTKLQARLDRMLSEPVDPTRLAQEVALMADRCAIDEELSRLDSHIHQMRSYLDAEGEIGKKMDFLIQEMNRETNTIGSKASDARIAQAVVDMKSEIEKLREQIQNVE